MIIFDPLETWKKTKVRGGSYTLRELLVPVFLKGTCVYESPKRNGTSRYLYQRKILYGTRQNVL